MEPDGFDVQNKRIPKSGGDKASEGDIVTITGWLHLVAFEGGAKGDEDYHIQVSDSLTDGGDCVIVEAPNPAFITNKALAKKSSDIRLWVRTNLLHNAKKIPSSKGNPMEHPPFVKATGQLFFDSTHDEGDDPSGGRGKKGMKAGTIWELHPLTDLRFAPKPQ